MQFWNRVGEPNERGCREWLLGKTEDGYGKVKIEGKTLVAHRVAFEQHWGVELPPSLMVLHHCDNRPCCEPEHLWIGMADTNSRDMVEKRRQATGVRNAAAKLSEYDTWLIVYQWNTGRFTERELADAMGVSVATISRVKRQLHWKNARRPTLVRHTKNHNHPKTRKKRGELV